MQKIIKALINFSKFTDSKLEQVCKAILQAMNGNANFKVPIPTLQAIQEAVDLYSTALIEAASRDRNKIALKNQYRSQLTELMRQLGNYVNTICMGDITMLTSSGYPLGKIPAPVHILAPKNLSILQGLNAGSIVCKISSVKGAGGYLYEICADAVIKNGNWISVPSSRTSFEFTDLEQGQKYWFRVAAVGGNNQVVYSNEVYQYVMQRNMEAAA